jgi:hypothetical protein
MTPEKRQRTLEATNFFFGYGVGLISGALSTWGHFTVGLGVALMVIAFAVWVVLTLRKPSAGANG